MSAAIPGSRAGAGATFYFPRRYDIHDRKVQVWLPLTLNPADPGGRGSDFLYLVGRLKEGVSLQQARVDLESMLQPTAPCRTQSAVRIPPICRPGDRSKRSRWFF